MKLELLTNNYYLKSKYNKTQANFETDSGFDLFCPETVTIPANTISFMLDLEVKTCCSSSSQNLGKFPYMIFPRSSMGSRTPLRLANSIGLIDKDYRGNLKLCLDNLSDKPFTVEQGMRLVQLVCFGGEPFREFKIVDNLDKTSRDDGGFGSTGG
jgi:dUTP pyrophosphatase